MSKPQWKIERERKEQEEKERKRKEEEAKQAAFRELEEKKKKLDQERAQADAEDEAKINALLEQRQKDGVRDTKEEALAKTAQALKENDQLCTACNESLFNSGPFVRLGDEKAPYHRACLVCGRCNQKNPGIQINDGVLTCFDCRQKIINS